ncbi:MAG TPA: PDZ domain-containing protein [Pyrinomonadaceae bacterium]|jgi:S1-C subfamily serine protease
MTNSQPGFWRRGARAFACALALPLCLAVFADARAQQATTNAPATTNANAPTPAPPVAAQAKAQTPPSRDASLHVIAVVHRLSGWRLRALLARPDVPAAAGQVADDFIRVNVVAGFVLPDGRSVVARLPRADAELLDFAAQFQSAVPGGDNLLPGVEPSALSLVRADGVDVPARFVGLDASTGLSLLEAEQPLTPPVPARAQTVPPAVGARVRVVAPLAAAPPVATNAPANATAVNDNEPVGETGTIYMNMSEAEGQLTQIKRSPTGKAVELTLVVSQASSEWVGGVALGEADTLVGIVAESDARAARLVSADTVRAAAARISARRASVPQPWLGARGDALAGVALDALLAHGWPAPEARTLLSRRQGIFLTDVAPDTPAARAGLRAGDVIARVSRHDVRGVEDLSFLLQELGSNAVADFTVLRANAPPLDLPVRLSGALNPALETAQAEARAAESEMTLAQRTAQAVEMDLRQSERDLQQSKLEVRALELALREADAADREVMRFRLDAARTRVQSAQTRFEAAHTRLKALTTRAAATRFRLAEAEMRIRAAGGAHFNLPMPALLRYGVEATRLWPPAGASQRPPGGEGQPGRMGLLVVGVRPESVAARAGVRVGDIIETVNARPAASLWPAAGTQTESSLTLGVTRDGQRLTLQLRREPDK